MAVEHLPEIGNVVKTAEETGPLAYSLLTYTWVFVLSAWGGMVSFHAKVKKGITRYCNIAELLGELFSSGFVGVLTFWLCEYSHLNQLLTAAFVGISGHMGARVIFLMERKLQSRAEKFLGEKFTDDSTNG